MTTDHAVDDTALRELAVTRLKKQSDFRLHLMIYLLVNGFLVAIWAMSGIDFFWPVFPIFGWGIGVAAAFWDAYLRDEPTEAVIRREVHRLQVRRGS